jgi:hypothetical protein
MPIFALRGSGRRSRWHQRMPFCQNGIWCVSYAETAVIDSILNLLFRCAHPRLTRPFSPVNLNGVSQGGAYVVCLDCGRQFAYDLTEMKIGRPIDRSHEAAVVPSNLPMPRGKKLKYAFWAAVPVAVAVGVALQTKKPKPDVNSAPVADAPGKPGEDGPPAP